MIEFFVSFFIIVFIGFLLVNVFAFPVAIGLNIILVIALFFWIRKDIKEEQMSKYYLVSILLTAGLLILNDVGIIRSLFRVMKYVLFLSEVTIALFFLHVFANLLMYAERYYKKKMKEYKKSRIRKKR